MRLYNLQSENTGHSSDFSHLKYQWIFVNCEICKDLTASKELINYESIYVISNDAHSNAA